MKKIFSLVLVLVLIFSFSVSAFASSYTSELDALNSIDNWSKSIWQVLTNKIAAEIDVMVDDLDLIATRNYTMLSYLLDISDFTRSTYQEIEAFTDSFFNEVSWGEPFAEVVQDRLNSIDSSAESLSLLVSEIPGSLSNIQEALYTIHGLGVAGWEDYQDSWFLAVFNDIHQLKEVLADEEDLAFKESQKDNQQYVQDTFFSSSSDLSLNLDDFGILTQYVLEFKTGYNFEENIGNPLPLTLINTESDFKDWFSDSTGQAMDPTFNGGSGGGGGEDPDPDPDPEPEPEPTIKNWLPLATTEPGGTEIYNGIGYLPGYRWSISGGGPSASSNYCLSGFLPLSSRDIYYFSGFSFDSSSALIIFYEDEVSRAFTSFSSFLVLDENGIYKFDTNSLNQYNLTYNYFRFVFINDSGDYLLTRNEYPIQTASTFSLRAQSVQYINEPEVVTSYYVDRLLEVQRIKGGNK